MKPATILISGAGQLGSRYLQGLAACRLPLQIHVHDIHPESLAMAQARWLEVATPATLHRVTYHSSLGEIPSKLEIAIVATTASVRPQVIREIGNHAGVQFWILEKVLAQSEAGLNEIVAKVGRDAKAWVNTPRRMLDWHQQIKAHLRPGHPMHLKVSGTGWGLACNSIHFLDMFAWWTGETLVSLNTDALARAWFESKRPGNWEVMGTLTAVFSGGSSVALAAKNGELFYQFELDDGTDHWTINEDGGIATRSDGLNLPGRLPFQSEVSGALVETILSKGTCQLPTLAQSLAIHRPFIAGLLAHWRATIDPQANAVPIT